MQHLRRSVGVDDQSSSLVYLQRKVGFFKIGRRWLWQNGQLYYVYLSSYKYLQIETDATGICISELNYITIGVMIKELIKIDFSACSKDTPRCISADMLRMLDRRGSLHKQTNEGWSERKQENNSKLVILIIKSKHFTLKKTIVSGILNSRFKLTQGLFVSRFVFIS